MTGLNAAQRAAAEAPLGASLVLAGAGSGKTRVIVERVVHLIGEQGVDPRNILALTFTNRAAREMQGRIATRLHLERLASWVGTFHSFGLFFLRREMDKLGRPLRFTVFDDTDQLSLMKRLAKEIQTTHVRVSPRDALSWVSRLKQDLNTPDDIEHDGTKEFDAYVELWKRYHAALERSQAVDFDDLLVLTARVLTENEDVRERYRRRYSHILVDEYQDTNRAQYVIVQALAGEGGDIFVVGDEDQAIYSWRGADIQNILDFEKDFPSAHVYRLEQNYRSTSSILDVANSVVVNNQRRLGKTLFTEQKGGDKVALYEATDAEDEARYVVDAIAKLGASAKDVAVLFRTNGQSRLVEEALRRKGIAYTVVGGVRFYGRKEVKDVLAYLRLLVNPTDDEALRRVINVPARGIGATSFERIAENATARGVTLFQAMQDAEEDTSITSRARKNMAGFVTLIDDLALEARTKSVAEVTEDLLERTGYREFVQESDEKDFRTRLEIVDELINACAEFDERQKGGVIEFLQDLALASDIDNLDPDAPFVTLLTCHSAKGLEFDHVFLMGLEEGLLPHHSSLDDDDEIEEERRLCYVAMTRARKTLTLTRAESRLLYGETRTPEASRFLGEISKDRLAFARRDTGAAPVARPAAPKASGDALKMGTRVRHARFGRGTVMYTSGAGATMNVRIRFDTGMSKQFRVSAAPIEILEGK